MTSFTLLLMDLLKYRNVQFKIELELIQFLILDCAGPTLDWSQSIGDRSLLKTGNRFS